MHNTSTTKQRRVCDLEAAFEWKKLSFPLIAVDEVGRGCLAGPVVAAAILVESCEFDFDTKITDSKKLTARQREALSQVIWSQCRTSIGSASPQEIDQFNIHQASFLAMKRAIEQLKVIHGTVLVDGKFKIPDLQGFEQIALIKGDLRAQPIGAASIVAKVYRDEQMIKLAKEFPDYGFEVHKGYATEFHRKVLLEKGASIHHRRSFKGVLPSGAEARDPGRDILTATGL